MCSFSGFLWNGVGDYCGCEAAGTGKFLYEDDWQSHGRPVQGTLGLTPAALTRPVSPSHVDSDSGQVDSIHHHHRDHVGSCSVEVHGR